MSNPRRKTGTTLTAEPSKAQEIGKEPRKDCGVEITVNGVRVEVSPQLEAAVHRAHKGLLAPLPTEMTTTQAADFLDVSRPFVIKLINQRVLPCRMVGKHRHIPTLALSEYREKMFQRAKTAADEMARISEKLGLYDEVPPN